MSAYKIQMPGNYPEESIQQCQLRNISAQNIYLKDLNYQIHPVSKGRPK